MNVNSADASGTRGTTSRSVRIGFVLASHSRDPLPSTRIAVLNMFPYLIAAGFEPEIVLEPASPTVTPNLAGLEARIVERQCRIVFLQKVHGPALEHLARRLSARGIATVFCVCDVVVPGMVDCTDATVAVTDHLRERYPPALRHKIHVVHDGIENPQVCKAAHGRHGGSRWHPLQAVLVTSTAPDRLPVIRRVPPWVKVTIVGAYAPDDAPMRKLREAVRQWRGQPSSQRLRHAAFLLSPRIRRVAWHPRGVYEHMQAADVGIIPVEADAATREDPLPVWQVKSENRLTLKTAVGLPVVASPVPSYEPVIEHGRNGFFARDRREWLAHLEALRDPDLRASIGQTARRSVIERYSMEEQARRLVAVLRGLV